MTLIEQYESALPIWLKDDGFPAPPLLARHHDDTVTMASLMIPQEMVFRTAIMKFMTDLSVKELIFGVDRHTKPGQGTKYQDVLTVFWWDGDRIEDYGFRFGVVNYRPPPNPIIEPIDWHNTFWNPILLKIVEEFYEHGAKQLEVFAHAGGGDLIKRMREMVTLRRTRIMQGQKPH